MRDCDQVPEPLISIGILAYNEASHIEALIDAIAAQTLLSAADSAAQRIEIICVPNGCTDDTPRLAVESFARLQEAAGPHVSARVCEIAEPGKPNAWNRFVHEFSSPHADVLLLIDGDITLADHDCLKALIAALTTSPEATVAVGLPTKNIAREGGFSLTRSASLAASSVTLSGPPGINGALYAAQADVVRNIWMPQELLVEDGFLHAMIVTDRFRQPGNPARVTRATKALYYYEARTKLRDILRHQRRLLLGTAMNIVLFDELWNLSEGEDAGRYVRDQLERDPNWCSRLVQSYVARRGWWALPDGLFAEQLFGRLRRIRRMPIRQAIPRLPIAIIGLLVDLPVLISGNRAFRRGEFRW